MNLSRLGNLLRTWVRKVLQGPRGRFVLAAIAVLFAAAAVFVHFYRTGTSVTTFSGLGPLARTTSAHVAGSDSFQLGLLGFAAVFTLAGVFYGRLSAITLPGGIGIKLTPEQQQQATAAVARRAGVRAQRPPAQRPLMLHLTSMAETPAAGAPEQVLQATADTVAGAAQAAQHTATLAEAMLRLARTSPDGLRVMAETIGIPQEEWTQLLTGTIPPGVWDTLADRALDQVP
jgi:hypothetical protein